MDLILSFSQNLYPGLALECCQEAV
jgi:hypothetical protein